jgi:ubiquitin carboxyl-terminal hydrolase L3|mmetsp:Transcript_87810/g.137555  ORF Transcript_87810/g.137555 Transcript_87810/m.137555 type:complete len:334 (+) Transcript_87810:53-1054(+)
MAPKAGKRKALAKLKIVAARKDVVKRRPAMVRNGSAKVLKRPASRAKTAMKVAKEHSRSAASIAESMEEVNWVPLESNPDMFTVFARHIGLPKAWSFVDVLGVDHEFLSSEMVPRPCLGVTLLFEYSDNLLRSQAEQQRKLKVGARHKASSEDVFFMKQYVGNACGTIAAIHCVANAAETAKVADDSPVGELLKRMKGKSPKVIGAALAEMEDFHLASEECAAGGQTEAPEADEDTNHHFICFVERNGNVFELDGVKPSPIDHGPVGGDFLEKVASVIKANFMDADPENIQFNMMALVEREAEEEDSDDEGSDAEEAVTEPMVPDVVMPTLDQ